ncbi:MAG: glutamate--tRNA ligase, partial [Steroidobacteraceae bacterium]|nr:glutamate--tRNA ligase [Steroidobacteraceae bacterium]MDW8259000.1 glutamate--tRNA ligase [Gammaproteobacteria bacterium]
MTAQRTRFAPSPTGELHLGNARTALFNFLLARHTGGEFLLRIEDTDRERCRPEFVRTLQEDLRWLGLQWDEGPFLQSERGALYEQGFATLRSAGLLYPCFCTPQELELSRRAQLAAGRAPRYAGTCRDLSAAERAARSAAGRQAAWRFRVPAGRSVEFDDLVHGPQRFATDDIGDFIVRRADGTAAFFFSNALDDAALGVTLVLRGADHLANTPRQLLLLEALQQPKPRYAHVALLLGSDGAPLSKRNGAQSLAQLRAMGYLPSAINNLLYRLGHAGASGELLDLERMAREFNPAALGRAPARFDPAQLYVWQRQAVQRLSIESFRAWLGAAVPAGRSEAQLAAWLAAVQPNVVLHQDAEHWARIADGGTPPLAPDDARLLRETDRRLFAAAAAAAAEHGADWAAITAAASRASGARGAALY